MFVFLATRRRAVPEITPRRFAGPEVRHDRGTESRQVLRDGQVHPLRRPPQLRRQVARELRPRGHRYGGVRSVQDAAPREDRAALRGVQVSGGFWRSRDFFCFLIFVFPWSSANAVGRFVFCCWLVTFKKCFVPRVLWYIHKRSKYSKTSSC